MSKNRKRFEICEDQSTIQTDLFLLNFIFRFHSTPPACITFRVSVSVVLLLRIILT